MKINRLLVAVGGLLMGQMVLAQNAIVAAGVKATGTGGSVTYSVGPIIFKKPDGSAASTGLQQPYEIMTLGTLSPTASTVALTYYPNPTDSSLHLILNQSCYDSYAYEVVAVEGKEVVASQSIGTSDTLIDLASQPAGIYLVTVRYRQQILKTFKIIKH
jgi:hypothetical protein